MSNLALYQSAPTPVLAPALVEQPDLIALLLNDKRSIHTRDAYARDLRDFFGDGDIGQSCELFVSLSVPQIRLTLLEYKTRLRERALSEATINRRLAAIRSLLTFAHRLGRCASDGQNIVEGERVTAYRDTRGVDVATLRKLLAAPKKRFGELSLIYIDGKCMSANAEEYTRGRAAHLHLLRDMALLHLLIENALRRGEVCALDVSDFDAGTRGLWILGKGKGNQKTRVSLSTAASGALAAYLEIAGHGAEMKSALFRNLDRNVERRGARITGDGLYSIIGEYGRAVGLKRLTPHQLRHSAITAALDATNGDVRRVQKLSRHKDVSTLMIYDDAREDAQGEISGLLSDLVAGKKKPRAR